jgi:predicted O-methyltransferase YrrM
MQNPDPTDPPVSGRSGETDERDFRAAWLQAESIPGWLKEGQARMLFDAARALPAGARVLEIGSHQGRSTVVLGLALRPRGGTLTCVDPFVDGRLFGGSPTRTKFEANVSAAGVGDLVDLVPEYSTKLRPRWDAPIDLLYVDGKHDYWTFSDDLRWADHLPEGGQVLVHDAYSSIGVTLGILAHVLPSSSLRYLRRSSSMALFERARPTGADRLRVVREMPWWVRNIGIKVLLRLRLRPVARLVGHDSPYDPY